MTRAKRFVEEALILIGEADDPNDLFKGVDDTTDTDVDGADPNVEPDVTDDTGNGDLDLGAESEDDFGLGGTTTPTVRIEKDGPITVNKGDVQLSIGDDGAIDISLDGGSSEEPVADLGDMSDKPAETDEPSPEEDDYKIDWDKEKEEEVPGSEKPKESLRGSEDTNILIQETEGNRDFEGQVISSLSRQQSPATSRAEISKARKVLGLESSTGVVTECSDKKYECMSCNNYEECMDKNKKQVPEEDNKDFLTQGYK
jgi:hypothetical protein